ncbi:modin [Colletotrichum karsti]|uniref:Modin n=1 Tax=Colletotrichum karsti TaxID=1095194 RepID=A0A9P6HX05_9PEZI|nr:modin [Colletotrichum karsti]KAF9872787.1 modin [Colletotrichum karsti]
MADPLSVAASIVGILAAAGKVIEIMGPYMSAVRDTPKIAVSVHSEVVNSRIVLSALHGLLDNLSTTSINRKLLVSIDDLVAVFTNGVFIFSELESSVSPMNLGASDRIMARMQWARKEGKLSAILERLHTFKETMMLLLNILQCGSDHRAVQNQDELSMKISGLMQEHVDLCRLLETNSDSFDALSIIESRRPAEPQRLSDDVSELQCFSAADTTKSNPGHSIPVPESSPIPTLEFQTVLDLSRPYKRARNGSIDCPTRTSVAASKAGSIFSGISLSEVSILSRIAIPVYPADISNSHHYEFMPSTVAKVYTARRPTAATIGRWAELMDKSASRASLGDDMCNDGCDDDGESTDDEGGVEWMDDEFEEEYMDGEIYRPPSLWKLDDVSPEDIWCTLVFRSICWLMLHDFHPHDVNIVPTELFGSRIPVYIA